MMNLALPMPFELGYYRKNVRFHYSSEILHFFDIIKTISFRFIRKGENAYESIS